MSKLHQLVSCLGLRTVFVFLCSSEMLQVEVCWQFGKLLRECGYEGEPGSSEPRVPPVLYGLGPKLNTVFLEPETSPSYSATAQINGNGGLTVGWNKFVNLRRAPGAKYNW